MTTRSRREYATSTEDKLFADLEEARWVALAQLADLAEEQGDARSAAGYHGLVKNKKHPQRKPPLPSRPYWTWSWSWYKTPNYEREHALQNPPYNRLLKLNSKSLKRLLKSAAWELGGWLLGNEKKP